MIISDTKIMLEIANLRALIEKKPDKLEKDAYERIADLEIKMAKLWNALLETTPTGKTKLTRFGRMFGGQHKDKL